MIEAYNEIKIIETANGWFLQLPHSPDFPIPGGMKGFGKMIRGEIIDGALDTEEINEDFIESDKPVRNKVKNFFVFKEFSEVLEFLEKNYSD